MKSSRTIDITFWGTRGSFPCSGKDYVKYGGNTSCVSCEIEGELIIFDAGSGLLQLSHHIRKKRYQQAHLFLTHFHLDHIIGLPFLEQNTESGFQLHLYCGTLKSYGGIEKTLRTLVAPPIIPFTIDDVKAQWVYHDILIGKPLHISSKVQIETFKLNHPNGAMGCKLTYDRKSVCYITDTEFHSQSVPSEFLNFIHKAQMVIFDTTYRDEEYAQYKGWGHSTWQEVVKICQRAQVDKVIFYHHAPHHTDAILDFIYEEAQRIEKRAIVAYDGLKIEI